MKTTRAFTITVIFLALAGCCVNDEALTRTRRNGTRSYEDYAAGLRYEPAMAAGVMEELRAKKVALYFDPTPLFVADGWYFFSSAPRKMDYSYTGYYVNGHSGAVEYRESPVVTGRLVKHINEVHFTKVVPLRPALEDATGTGH